MVFVLVNEKITINKQNKKVNNNKLQGVVSDMDGTPISFKPKDTGYGTENLSYGCSRTEISTSLSCM